MLGYFAFIRFLQHTRRINKKADHEIVIAWKRSPYHLPFCEVYGDWCFLTPPGQDGRHFADDIIEGIFLNEVPKGPTDNN